MKVKKYKFFKAPDKTAEENGLIIVKGIKRVKPDVLFDFSLLDEMKILEEEKEVIKRDALKNIRASNKLSFYGSESNNFTYCLGKASYHIQRVYSLTGKLRYNIFSLARIEHHHYERKNITDAYEHIKFAESNGYDEAILDIEL